MQQLWLKARPSPAVRTLTGAAKGLADSPRGTVRSHHGSLAFCALAQPS